MRSNEVQSDRCEEPDMNTWLMLGLTRSSRVRPRYSQLNGGCTINEIIKYVSDLPWLESMLLLYARSRKQSRHQCLLLGRSADIDTTTQIVVVIDKITIWMMARGVPRSHGHQQHRC